MVMPVGPVMVSDRVALIVLGVAAVVAVAGVWYVSRKASAALEYIEKDALNVTSDKNIANVAVNKVLQTAGVLGQNDLTGKPNTIGSWLFEITH